MAEPVISLGAEHRLDVLFQVAGLARSTFFYHLARLRLPDPQAEVKLLWLAICDIEDKRARDRAKERGMRSQQRKASGRLVEGQVTTNWRPALQQLSLVYPERIIRYL